MEKVQNGNYVSVEYTGKLENGQVFDSSIGRQPLEVHMGAGQMIAGFEAQLMGMSLNERKVFTLSPEEAYGPHNDDLMQTISREEVPEGMKVETGMIVGLVTPDGQRVPARVVALDDRELTLDFNHPLAGEKLTFEIEVVGISGVATQEPAGCPSDCDCSGGKCPE